jgi:hypothetical protein
MSLENRLDDLDAKNRRHIAVTPSRLRLLAEAPAVFVAQPIFAPVEPPLLSSERLMVLRSPGRMRARNIPLDRPSGFWTAAPGHVGI